MTDDYSRGFLEGIEIAARILRNHIDGIPDPSEEPTIPLAGARIDSDGLTGSRGTSGRGERHEAATGRFSGFWYVRQDGSIPASLTGIRPDLADACDYTEGRPLRVVAVYEVEEGQ